MPRSKEESLQCMSMHQPWASLLVAGIKRVEGRSWPTDHRGRLWIASTAQEPDAAIVYEMEGFYREIHALEGNTPAFPQHYPKGVLLGCVHVVDCVTAADLKSREGLPEGLRQESESAFCFLCQRPQRLVVPQQIKGQQKIWPLPASLAKQFSPALKPVPSIGREPFSWSTYGFREDQEKPKAQIGPRRIQL